MGGGYKYKQFFRFRTPATIEGFGVRVDAMWMALALKLIDFNKEVFLNEVVFINRVIPGAFTYQDLYNLEFDQYELLLDSVIKIAKEKKNG